jgi:hypothetical protein
MDVQHLKMAVRVAKHPGPETNKIKAEMINGNA